MITVTITGSAKSEVLVRRAPEEGVNITANTGIIVLNADDGSISISVPGEVRSSQVAAAAAAADVARPQ